MLHSCYLQTASCSTFYLHFCNAFWRLAQANMVNDHGIPEKDFIWIRNAFAFTEHRASSNRHLFKKSGDTAEWMNIENQTLKKKTKNKFSLGNIQKEPYILNSLEGVMLKNTPTKQSKYSKYFALYWTISMTVNLGILYFLCCCFASTADQG